MCPATGTAPPVGDTRRARPAASRAGRRAAVLAAALIAIGANGAEYTIVGNLGDAVGDGEAVLSRSTAVLGSTAEIARTPIAEGRFSFSGEITDNMGRVALAAKDPDGNAKGSVQFILEPGEIRIGYGSPVAGLTVAGGHYNQRVISVWRDAEGYREVLDDYGEVMAAKADLEEGPEREALTQEAIDIYNELNGIRREALQAIAESDDDPLASLFAMEMGGLGGTAALARLDQLQAVAELPAAAAAFRSRTETGIRMSKTARTVEVGTRIRDFTAVGLDGETYRLGDSLASNEVVLVEFWASWCGPCRAEVPTLKAAVERFGDKGFDIFAFSLDDNREDWEEASVEDGITWINTCDFNAYDSPVAGQFGVLAIPMNILVDADGIILAKYVRGEELLARLGELLGEA